MSAKTNHADPYEWLFNTKGGIIRLPGAAPFAADAAYNHPYYFSQRVLW